MRIVILASFLATFLAAPVLALDTVPIHEPEPAVKQAAFSSPASRIERWRGAPYVRVDHDRAEQELRNRRLVSDGELTSVPSLQNGELELLRREALDKRLPLTLAPSAAF